MDHLLDLGFQDITVLDISAAAIERAKHRLGEKASRVKWIVADATVFRPAEKYDFWHDRAAFHFLTQDQEIANYINTIQKSISPTGVLVIGTFSEQGPKKCSGIEITQYSETSLQEVFKQDWEQTKNLNVIHRTPFKTEQAFVFSVFSKRC